MQKALVGLFSVLLLSGCQYLNRPNEVPDKPVATQDKAKPVSASEFILQAERQASKTGRQVLATGRKMALVDETVIAGSCWDYANAVYKRAGYDNEKKRQVVFNSKKKGPYVQAKLIQPGDFLHYINHSYGDIEHSAIFVGWLDYQRKEALMLSYGGQGRKQPARYRPYDLSNVYHITRPKP
jgi:hypothetical protein